jgi:16S rRNA (adenine1518-N6/adenine1519-N6)-dimethyltransferase
LQEKFSVRPNFSLIEQDIREVIPAEFDSGITRITLIGNIPYDLSGEIAEWIVRHRDQLMQAVLTVQKEVAERIVAQPGSKQFGSLTVLLQSSYAAKKILDLRPGSFYPKPKVSSSVVHLTRLNRYLVADDELPCLRRLVRACFRWRRKQMVRILREEYQIEPAAAKEVLDALDVDPTRRPEQLPVEVFASLARKLECSTRDSGS